MKELYKAVDLCQRYGKVEAIRGCNFVIHEGDLICVTGPNGAGKSTLLDLLAFLNYPSDGELWFKGSLVQPAMGRESLERVTLVLQHPYIFHGSVRSNLETVLKARRISKPERDERIHDALDQMNLTHLANRPGKSLSSGEQRRVALARALCLRTSVLLLDEPMANVSEEHLPVIENLIRHLRTEEGVTIVIATLDRGLASRLGAELWHMYEGSLLPRLEVADAHVDFTEEGRKYAG